MNSGRNDDNRAISGKPVSFEVVPGPDGTFMFKRTLANPVVPKVQRQMPDAREVRQAGMRLMKETRRLLLDAPLKKSDTAK